MNAAYDELTQSAPLLPRPGSVLPALLAVRKTRRIIDESRAYLASQKLSLDGARKRLEAEQAHLRDQELLQKALDDRIAALRSGLESSMAMTSEQVAKEKLDELRQKKRDYDKDTSKLLKALKKFIDDHLGAMLAAEELGGPVVGEMMDMDTDDLAAGFTARGKVKKAKTVPDQDKRQRRIEDIWGDGQAQRGRNSRTWDEPAAAGAEMRALVEELLNSLVESGGRQHGRLCQDPSRIGSGEVLGKIQGRTVSSQRCH